MGWVQVDAYHYEAVGDVDDELERESRVAAVCRRYREQETRGARAEAEARMTHRTDMGRRFEEHRCPDMPRGWRVRRYGPEVGRWWTAHVPYCWEVVRINHCDEWLDDEESAAPVTGLASEPTYCPWCGVELKRCDEAIRGWRP